MMGDCVTNYAPMSTSSLISLYGSGTNLLLCSRGDARRKGASPLRVEVLPDAAALQAQRHLRGEWHLTLPATDCLLGVADFPSTDPEELAGMVALRIEEISPFPADRTFASWEILAPQGTGSRVFYALCSQAALEPMHAVFRAKKWLLHRVDVDVMAWWTLLQPTLDTEATVLALLALERQTLFFAVERGLPAAIGCLGDLRDQDGSVVLEELDFALATLESERGAFQFSQLHLWTDAGGLTWDTEVLGAALSLPVIREEVASLPPLAEGLMRRAEQAQDRPLLDLSPPEWKAEEAENRFRRTMLRAAAGVAGVWLLFTAGLWGLVQFRDYQFRQLRAEVTAQTGSVETVQALAQQVRSLTQFTDRERSALEVLRVIAESTPGPGRILVRDLQYRKAEGVTISGESSGDFFLFQEALSASPILDVVDFDTREVRGTTEFRVVTGWNWEREDPL